MRLCFRGKAWDQYMYWYETDKAQFKRINTLIKDIRRSPFAGIGMPEPLKHELTGFWSRRIDLEHRLVYLVTETEIIIAQCRYHY